jgi:hypothetical protein
MKKIEIPKEVSAVRTDKYSKNRYNFPSSSLVPEQKGEAYHKEWAEKLYSLFVTSNAWMPSSVYSTIDENRAYAAGKQSMEQVKDWILGRRGKPKDISAFDANGFDIRDSESPETRRKAWEVIDFSPVSVAPKIWTKINEDVRSLYYEMTVNAVDSYSVRSEEHEKFRLWFYKENQKWIESQQMAVGIQPTTPDFIPENMEELELYAQTGGFKVPYSISMEDLLKHTFEVSDWDKEVAERVREDLFSNGYAMLREEYDREIKRVVVKDCDIKYSGVQYSRKASFKDAEYGFHLDFMEISQVRQRLNMDHEQAAALAYSFSGQYGNPVEAEWEKFSNSGNENGQDLLGCDFYKIPVFNFDFIDIDTENYVEFTDKTGASRMKPYKGEIQDNEELKASQIRYVRTGKWIVGTEHIFDFGKKEYIPRDAHKKPRISYRAVKLSNTPLIEQIKVFVKGFGLAWVKAQHAISMAVGNGLAVDVGSLKNISIGKDKSFDPMEILAFYRQSTFLLYKKQSSLSGFNKYASPPIIPINNSSYQNIEAQFNAMNFYMQKIEEVSGISMVATGKAADPYTPKYGLELSLQGTNSIINSIVRAQTDIQEDVSVNVCYRIRSYCRVNEIVRKSYENVIGERRMKVFVEAEKNNVEYGLSIKAANVAERKQAILGLLQASIDPSGSGESGKLSVSEAIIIYDMLHQNQNIRRIGLVLGYMIRKKEREAHQKKLQYIDQQNQGLAQIEQMKQQAEAQRMQHEMMMADKKFWSDFTIKYGRPPEEVLGSQEPNALQTQQ